MTETAQRLAKGVEVLGDLDRRRSELGDPDWGRDLEEAILQAELLDLEEVDPD
jgi:hypothetical protein